MAVSTIKVTRDKVRGYTYAMLHMAMHFVIAGLLYFAFQPDLSTNLDYLLPILFGMVAIDLDHIPLWIKVGIRKYIRMRNYEERGKPRKYLLHNLLVIFIGIGGSLLVMIQTFRPYGLFFMSMTLHLLWDMFEDVMVFDMGYGHWI